MRGRLAATALTVTLVLPAACGTRVDRQESMPAVAASGTDGWISGRLFELGARQAAQPLTRQSLLAALSAINGDPLGDLTVPYRFNPGRPATPTTCYWFESPRDGRWTSPDGGQRHCFEHQPDV